MHHHQLAGIYLHHGRWSGHCRQRIFMEPGAMAHGRSLATGSPAGLVTRRYAIGVPTETKRQATERGHTGTAGGTLPRTVLPSGMRTDTVVGITGGTESDLLLAAGWVWAAP